jgi:hypothetical protein
MWPATVGFLLLVAVVFLFGVLSARSAARRARDSERSAVTAAVDSSPAKENKPKGAMAMAGATGANKPDSESGPYMGS